MSRNRTNTAVRAALPLCLAVLAVGCAAEANLRAETVLNHHHCEGLEPGVTRVDLPTVAAIRGSNLLSAPGGAATAEGDTELLMIAISRGQQATAGYGWSLEGARVEGATAVVDVHWQTPDPDAMVAQVITHPCLVVGLPHEGLSRVEVRDQTGEPVGSVDL
ncbi:MAG: protease complex subunit PrcB family protein [Pseudomonadales bacterium]